MQKVTSKAIAIVNTAIDWHLLKDVMQASELPLVHIGKIEPNTDKTEVVASLINGCEYLLLEDYRFLKTIL